VLVVGSVQSGAEPDWNLWAARFDWEGRPVWQRQYSGPDLLEPVPEAPGVGDRLEHGKAHERRLFAPRELDDIPRRFNIGGQGLVDEGRDVFSQTGRG